MHDDGFHEIQLNGKQLVFLFMAATVVSVVIFLIGVMVGRSVGEQRAAAAETAVLDEIPSPDVTATAGSGPDAPPPQSDPTKAAAPTSVEDLSYFNRLESQKQPAETVKPTPAAPAPAPGSSTTPPPDAAATRPPAATPPPATQTTATSKPPAPKPAAPAPTPPAAASAAPASGQGWVLQVAAVNAMAEANSVARRWTSKGYKAYVEAPAGSSKLYRVRIGPYPTRRDAEAVQAKLNREEKVDTWVTAR
jgi:cell division septation protein DedD